MKNNSMIKNNITINYFYNDVYFKKNGLIVDKLCPKCNSLIFDNKDFCECGFYLKGYKDNSFWSAILAAGGVLLILCTMSLVLLHIHKDKIFTNFKIDNDSFTSLSPINIQILSEVKKTKYYDYIQNAYTRHDNKSNLVILIKPYLWNTLKEKEK